jgi:MYST family zinc finger domain
MPAATIPPSPNLPFNISPNPKSRRRRTSLSGAERNVREVILSDLRVEAWYPSFYPEELIGKSVELLFVCKWCFKYSTKLIPFMEHNTVHSTLL